MSPDHEGRRRLHAGVAFTLALCLAPALGCASSPEPETPATGAAPGPGLWRFVEAPPADRALVLIFRPPRRGRTGWATVYRDDEILAIFGYSSFLAQLVEPGAHRYMVVSEAADFLDAELEGGKVYFAEIVPRTGVWRARFSLVPYPPGHERLRKLEAWLAKSTPVVPGARERDWAADNAASVAEKRDAYLEKWLRNPDRPRLDRGLTPDSPPRAEP